MIAPIMEVITLSFAIVLLGHSFEIGRGQCCKSYRVCVLTKVD